jgi:two-component system sensor histidine kinase/response regulator
MSIITHDLRTPLINVQNYLELLNEEGINTDERPVLEKALLRSTNNAVEMLTGLLHWSRSQMEGPNVKLQEVRLTEVLLRTLEIEKLHAARKNITLKYDLPADLMVYADADMLQLVVRNLVSNAIKFTQTEGLITITARQEDDLCILMVRDNGQGISADKQKGLFSISTEPSYGTNNERGVGLGLVLCKEYIERQAGTISFESELGKGSVFIVSIPSQFTS